MIFLTAYSKVSAPTGRHSQFANCRPSGIVILLVREDRLQRRVSLRRKLVELKVTPSIGGLVDLGVAIEVDEARTREWRRREHEVEWLDGKQIWILVNPETAPEHRDRPRHPR